MQYSKLLAIRGLYVGFCVITTFFVLSSCRFLSREEVISREGYVAMLENTLEKNSDVVNLFPKSVADVKVRCDYAIDQAKKDLNMLIQIDAPKRTFDNTARALDEAGAKFSVCSNALGLIEQVHPDQAMRDACHEATIKLQNFAVDAFLSVELYQAFKSYETENARKENLTQEEKYYLEETMKDFIRAGLHLPEVELKNVKRLQKELAQLALEFERNINDDKSSITVPREALEGVSEHMIKQLKRDSLGCYILPCDTPTVQEIAKHCVVKKTRQLHRRAFNNRAYPANKTILESIIAKRDELAKCLGFASYAQFDIDNQMAKKAETAVNFIEDLARKVTPKERQEFERLCKDLPDGVVVNGGKFDPEDLAYVQEAYKKKHFSIDDREIAEYFSMERTIDGIFDIYQQFLGLTFKNNKPAGLWHDDVSMIEVYSHAGTQLEAYIILDLYPRDNKYSHACMCGVVPVSFSSDGKKLPGVLAVIANFPKSTAERPSLLKHSDVETFFHEFGHAMHDVLGRTHIKSFAGTATKRDFVEVPSQMFEEWMWNKEMLKRVSAHYKTGAPLSDTVIDAMIELKRFDSGYFVQRQCYLSLLSLAYFQAGAKKDLDVILGFLFNKWIKHVHFDSQTHMYASFGHLTGYSAKYYGYMWAKVFALDIFDTIRSGGLLDPGMGRKLVTNILGRGGSVDPNILLKDFLEREPNQEAFLQDIGVAE